MLIRKYNRFEEIPKVNNILYKIPIFATQKYADYLKEIKNHDTLWLACADNEMLSCFIPIAISKKFIFKRGYFITGVIFNESNISFEKEIEFLENVLDYVKKNNLCDWIQQGPNWALFNTAPSGSISVQFGTYKLFLKDKSEDELYRLIKNSERGNINKAIKSEVIIKKGADYIKDCLSIVNLTAKEANISSLTMIEARKLLAVFKDDLKIYVSYFDYKPQSAAILIRNEYCTYGLYAGTIANAFRGANAYLWWEAIRDAKVNNCEYFDFVGARVNPAPGSKIERIQRFKKHFGSEFVQGYLWKFVISKNKFIVYKKLLKIYFLLLKKKIKKDIIEQELERQNLDSNKPSELVIYRTFNKIPDNEKLLKNIPVFATQNYADFIKEFNDHDTIWFAYTENGKITFLLPFAIYKKYIFIKGYFLTGVISLGSNNPIDKEKEFLEDVISCIKKNKLCHWIRQGLNWALFNSVPSGSKATEFGTYRILLRDKSEDEIYKLISKSQKRNIQKAITSGIEIKKGLNYINDCLNIIDHTARGANIHSPTLDEINKLHYYFKDNLKIYVSYLNDIPQCSTIFISNEFCTYGLYAGRKSGAFRSSNAYLDWEAIKDAKKNNNLYFDFVGARMNPEPDSKIERIQNYKKHFGCDLIRGYIWKMVISEKQFKLYKILLNTYSFVFNKKFKKDIIDQEIEKQSNEANYSYS